MFNFVYMLFHPFFYQIPRHYYEHTYHRVPVDWDFPRCGVRDLWRQWWVGDSRRQVPPLRIITHADVKHLDKRPITEEELHGRRGKNKLNRREATKVLCDMKFMIAQIQLRLDAHDLRFLQNEPVTQRRVNDMFAAINDSFLINERDVQKSWLSVVRDLREVSRKSRAAFGNTGNDDDDDDYDNDYDEEYEGFYEY
jgi:hypothetical protein